MSEQNKEREANALGYATRLAESLWRQHYQAESPHWKPLDTVSGVLTQIDNMVSGMTRKASQSAEPVASRCEHGMDICGLCGTPPAATGAQGLTDERDAFEAAYVAHLNTQPIHAEHWISDYTADEIKSMRSGDYYDPSMSGVLLPGSYLNGCWSGWKFARTLLAQSAPAATVPSDCAQQADNAVRAISQLCDEIKQALDVIDKRHGVCGATEAIHEKADAIVSILRAAPAPSASPAARAGADPETGQALRWATQLAQSLWRKHYKDEAPNWEPLPDLVGVISQIDNMATGLIRATPAAASHEYAQCCDTPNYCSSARRCTAKDEKRAAAAPSASPAAHTEAPRNEAPQCDHEWKRSETITVTDRSHGNADGTRTLRIEPDVLMDFRDLPYPDGSFKLVAFDPPHLVRAGPRSWMAAKYGKLGPDWREDIRKGFAECLRVLEPGGVLVFKWNETQVKVSEVLALAPQQPLFGQVSGKQGFTHWLVFMKGAANRASKEGV